METYVDSGVDLGLTFGDQDLEGFKRGVAEFCKAAPTADRESLENGWKALGLMYLGFTRNAASDNPLAVSYLNFAAKRYNDRDWELIRAEARGESEA